MKQVDRDTSTYSRTTYVPVTVTRNARRGSLARPDVAPTTIEPRSLPVVDTTAPDASFTSAVQVIVDLSGIHHLNDSSQSSSAGNDGTVTRPYIDVLIRVIPPGTPNAGDEETYPFKASAKDGPG